MRPATYDYDRFKFVSTFGTQYTDVGFTRTDAFGAKLLSGTGSLAGTTARFAVSETNSDVKTLGFLGRQQVAWADKLFLTGGIRTDRNSAFGVNFARVYYPSISASWVLSEGGNFPKIPAVSSLRLRAAAGSAGQNPGYLAAEQFYNPVAVAIDGTDVPAFTVGGAGNPNLKPEKSTEMEVGLDLGLFSDRLNIEYTHYNKITRDALVNVNLAPSLGTSTNRFQNLGRVRNLGDELVVRAALLNSDRVKFDLLVNGSWTKNNLDDLGVDENGVAIPQFTGGFDDTQIFKTGLPLGAYFVRGITSVNDANKDGMIACPEGPGSTGLRIHRCRRSVVPGYAVPARSSSTSRRRRARTLRSRHGDVRSPRRSEALQSDGCVPQFHFPQWIRGTVADVEQSRRAGRGTGSDQWSEWRLHRGRVVHEASRGHAFALPAAAARRPRARHSATLTFAGRNLHTWTKYTGLDPELNAGAQLNFSTADFLTAPQVRYFTARLALGF